MKEIDDLSWVVRGKQRREIIPHLSGPINPTALAKRSGYSLNHTSRVLNDFRKKGLVKLLNPKEKTGRLYELSPKGKKVKDQLLASQ